MKKRIYVPQTIPITRSLWMRDVIAVGPNRSRPKRMWTWLMVRLGVYKEVHTEDELRSVLDGGTTTGTGA